MTHAIALYLAMGGYARFVWPAYGVTITVLGGLAFLSWRRYRESRVALDAAQRTAPPARPRKAMPGGIAGTPQR